MQASDYRDRTALHDDVVLTRIRKSDDWHLSPCKWQFVVSDVIHCRTLQLCFSVCVDGEQLSQCAITKMVEAVSGIRKMHTLRTSFMLLFLSQCTGEVTDLSRKFEVQCTVRWVFSIICNLLIIEIEHGVQQPQSRSSGVYECFTQPIAVSLTNKCLFLLL